VSWTDRAKEHLTYLDKCRDRDEQVEYLASALKFVEAEGALRGVQELGLSMGMPKEVLSAK
jgi:hypothetical protein